MRYLVRGGFVSNVCQTCRQRLAHTKSYNGRLRAILASTSGIRQHPRRRRHRRHNPKVGGSNSPPATIEMRSERLVRRHRRPTGFFAFGRRSKIGVSRGFFSGPTPAWLMQRHAGWRRARSPYAAPGRLLCARGEGDFDRETEVRMSVDVGYLERGNQQGVGDGRTSVGEHFAVVLG